ncbi:TPA: DUF1642 domain-containing protein [Streptococcus agalactiae]
MIDEILKRLNKEFDNDLDNYGQESYAGYMAAIDMYDNLTSDNRGGYYHDVWLWAIDHHNDFISAWMHGYTIEKEKLYTVEIPNPNSDLKIILVKVNKKLKLIEAYEDQLEEYKNIRNVTESEIRKDFDWAWQFRKDVENE